MTGGNGSGKTTYALQLAKTNGSVFFSLDKTILNFNEVINSYEDYMTYYHRALDLMSAQACLLLKEGKSVVFDFGGGIATRTWLKNMAKASGAEIEIYHLEVPLEERRRRVQERNKKQDENIYFFYLDEKEFDNQNKDDPPAPPSEPGIQVIRIKNY
jgi:predicted kinase